MTYVTLRPNSNSNKSDKHLVVEFAAWRDYMDGAAAWFPTHSQHDTSKAAQDEADRLNAEEQAKRETA